MQMAFNKTREHLIHSKHSGSVSLPFRDPHALSTFNSTLQKKKQVSSCGHVTCPKSHNSLSNGAWMGAETPVN